MSSLVCPLCCPQNFDSVIALREHLLYFVYRPLLCAICSVPVNGIYELTRHLETHVNCETWGNHLKNDYGSDPELHSKFGSYCDIENGANSKDFSFKNSCLQEEASFVSKSCKSPSELHPSQEFTGIGRKAKCASSHVRHSTESQEKQFSDAFTSSLLISENSEDKLDACGHSDPDPEVANAKGGLVINEDSENTAQILQQPSEHSKPSCSPNGSDNGDSVRAFVCEVCGFKFVGKDLYFEHLLEGCKPKLFQKKHETELKEPNSEDQVDCSFISFPELSRKDSSSLERNQPDVSTEALYNDPVSLIEPDRESLSQGQVTLLGSQDYFNLDIPHADKSNFSTIYSADNTVGNFCQSNSEHNYFGVYRNSSCNKDNDYLKESKIETNSVHVLGNSSNQKSTQPYIHKKFDHDQDRKTEVVETLSDVQCCIQNFQSLLVKKLNQALEANHASQLHIENPNEEDTSAPRVDTLLEYMNPAKIDSESRESFGESVSYRCEYCPKSFSQQETRDTHAKTHNQKDVKECPTCHKVFFKTGLLRRHQREFHSTKVYKCKICTMQFRSQRSLDNHKGIHEQKRLKCSKCSYICHTASGLRTHTFKTHSSEVTEFSCSQCGETFKRKYGLQRHFKRKHVVENFVCKYCDKIFPCKEDLGNHMTIHLNEKSLTCPVCDKLFTTTSSLKRHSTSHKEQTQEYKCEKCSAVFTRKDSLLSHMKLHDLSREYKCKCGKGFNKLSQLKYHEVKHRKEPKYRCETCKKIYKFKISLRNHICKIKIS